MNTTHTKGPWTAETEKDSHVIFIRGPIESTESIANIGKYSPDHNAEANARLIASAPELLTALESIRDTANRSDIGVLDRALIMFETAKAAIAKATGH